MAGPGYCGTPCRVRPGCRAACGDTRLPRHVCAWRVKLCRSDLSTLPGFPAPPASGDSNGSRRRGSCGPPRFSIRGRERPPILFQVKCPCPESSIARANACACHGSANTGPPSSRGNARLLGSVVMESDIRSGRLEILVPQIDVDRVVRCSLRAPQLVCGEPYRVDVLRSFALKMGIGIREDENTVVAVNRADLRAHVAGQAGVAEEIGRAHGWTPVT